MVGRSQARPAPICGYCQHRFKIRLPVATQKLCVLDPSELATELRGDASCDQLFAISSQAGAAEGHGVAELDARLEQVGSQAEDLDDLRDSAFFFDLGIMPLILFLDEAGGLALLNHLDPGHALLLAQPPTIELASTVKLVDKAAFFHLFDEAEIDKIFHFGLGCPGIERCLDL